MKCKNVMKKKHRESESGHLHRKHLYYVQTQSFKITRNAYSQIDHIL